MGKPGATGDTGMTGGSGAVGWGIYLNSGSILFRALDWIVTPDATRAQTYLIDLTWGDSSTSSFSLFDTYDGSGFDFAVIPEPPGTWSTIAVILLALTLAFLRRSKLSKR